MLWLPVFCVYSATVFLFAVVTITELIFVFWKLGCWKEACLCGTRGAAYNFMQRRLNCPKNTFSAEWDILCSEQLLCRVRHSLHWNIPCSETQAAVKYTQYWNTCCGETHHAIQSKSFTKTHWAANTILLLTHLTIVLMWNTQHTWDILCSFYECASLGYLFLENSSRSDFGRLPGTKSLFASICFW